MCLKPLTHQRTRITKNATCTPPELLVFVKVEEAAVLKVGVTFATSCVGTHNVLLPVSNCTPMVCDGVPICMLM